NVGLGEANRRVPPLSYDRGAPRPLVADDQRPSTVEGISPYAGFFGGDTRGATRRGQRGGRRSPATQTHHLQARQDQDTRSERPRSSLLPVLYEDGAQRKARRPPGNVPQIERFIAA